MLEYLRPYVQLYKVDLKSFRDAGYRQLGGRLPQVLETIRELHALGFWVEIVTLLVPGWNDSEEELRGSRAHDNGLLGRWAEPREIAYPILFLSCAESSFITGTTLLVDAGKSVI